MTDLEWELTKEAGTGWEPAIKTDAERKEMAESYLRDVRFVFDSLTVNGVPLADVLVAGAISTGNDPEAIIYRRDGTELDPAPVLRALAGREK
jgi:hypothetical protein